MLLSTKLDLSEKVFDKVQGVDYDEIFSLVAMLKSVRIMLGIGCQKLHSLMDIKEELYMMQPEGLLIQKVLTKCASSSDPFMDWCKHLGVGINALIS